MPAGPEVTHAAYLSIKDRTTATEAEFLQSLDGWDVVPVHVSGELAGAVLMKGMEIHACILPQFFGRWLTRAVLRDTLFKVLKEYGRAITKTTAGNSIGAAFVGRLGFVELDTKDGVTTYEVKYGI